MEEAPKSEGAASHVDRGMDAAGSLRAGDPKGAAAKEALSDDDVDSEAGDSLITFDYAALEEAQRIASQAPTTLEAEDDQAALKRKQRGGCKESKQRRKKQKREDDVLRAKKAGLPVPSLKDILARAAAKAKAAPATSSASGSGETKTSDSQAAAAPLAEDGKSEPSCSSNVAAAVEAKDGVHTEACSADDPRTAAALRRVAKENARRALVAQAQNARTVFVTNLPFKTTEQEIKEWLGTCGEIKSVRLSRDKATTKSLGYAHVQFASPTSVEVAIEKCDRFDVQGRVVRLSRVAQGESFQFELPQEIKDDIRALMQEFEGRNLSTIKDAWQKRHPGQKLNTSKWGFKNFSTAMRTIEGVCLEHHLEKTLTYLAFFQGSPAHHTFIEEKRRREEAASASKAAPAAGDKRQDATAAVETAGAAAEQEVAGGVRREEAAADAQTAGTKTEDSQQAGASTTAAEGTIEGEQAAEAGELRTEDLEAAVARRAQAADAVPTLGSKVDETAACEPPTKQRRLNGDSHDEACAEVAQGDAVMA